MSDFDPITIPLNAHHLIEASAGTGKTYSITNLYLRFLLEADRTVSQILTVTYTEAATQELRDRVRRRLAAAQEALERGTCSDANLQSVLDRSPDTADARERITAALNEFDDAAIFTIHGFCHRMLQECAFESGTTFDAELVTDSLPISQQIALDFRRREARNWPPEFAIYAARMLSADTLLYFIEQHIGKQFTRVVPEEADVDIETAGAKLRNAYTQLQAAWQCSADRKEAAQRLKNEVANGVLNKASYKPDSIDNLFTEADEWLNADVAALPLPAAVNKLSSSMLRSKTNKGRTTPRHELFDLFDAVRETADVTEAAFSDGRVQILRKLLTFATREVELRKERLNVIFFDDLLTRVDHSIPEDGTGTMADAIRARFPVAMIDEFQDTDPAQYSIFRKVYLSAAGRGTTLLLIGDPKQSIYRFRGADIFAYLAAQKTVPDHGSLLYNWRSEPDLLKAVSTLFAQTDDPFLCKEISYAPVQSAEGRNKPDLLIDGKKPDAPMILWTILEETQQGGAQKLTKGSVRAAAARAVALEAAKLLADGASGRLVLSGKDGKRPLGGGDIAVLVRTNFEGECVQAALNNASVPCVRLGDQSVFASFEARELELVLSAVAHPDDERLLCASLLTRIYGISARELYDLRGDTARWEEVLQGIRDDHRVWNERGFIQMQRRLLAQARTERVLAEPGGERAMTNYMHLGELLQKHWRADTPGMEGLIKWLAEKRRAAMEQGGSSDEEQLRLESDEERVKIVTIHKSKGLEYPIVFCPYLWYARRGPSEGSDLRYHDDDGARVLSLGGGDEEARAKTFREMQAEDRRLVYVALTRAINRCYIICPAMKHFDEAALGSLIGGRE